MKVDRIGIVVAVLCGALALPTFSGEAWADRAQSSRSQTAARSGGNAAHPARVTARPVTTTRTAGKNTSAGKSGLRRVAINSAAQRGGGGGGLSCVPYARMVTGMNVSGNAAMWWHNAAGSYLRGQRPENGSVLVFRATGSMGRGHVAVVERVVNSREILINHSNWGGPGIRRGSVMRGVSVLDASDNNDWSVVRVQVGHDTVNYGRNYPTYGFIHNRPDTGRVMRADSGGSTGFEEVADAARSPHAVAHEALSLESLTNARR